MAIFPPRSEIAGLLSPNNDSVDLNAQPLNRP
jgi:hypothetical protein